MLDPRALVDTDLSREAAGMRRAVCVAGLVIAGACACNESPPARTCGATIWARPSRQDATLAVIGSWNDWHLPGIPMRASDDPPWRVARVDPSTAPPGEYGYLVLEDGVHRLDEHNPLSTFWTEKGDLEVSLLVMPDCSTPALAVESVDVVGGTMRVAAAFAAADDGAALVKATAVTREGIDVPVTIEGAGVRAELGGLARGKHTLTVTTEDAAGRTASARAAGFVGPAAETWADGLLYQIVTDRFRGAGGAALDPPATPGSRAGGTLSGITAEIEAGTFAAMGVTGLWISPVYVNPEEAREGRGDGHMYEGYHGYWVQASRGVDPRIGGEAGLDGLIDVAHANGLRVLLDVVPNHMYEANPRFAERASDDLFHWAEPACVCGLGSCDWGSYIRTCWFTTYLPDVRLEQPAALRLAYEDLVWWAERFDSDGVRVDAVPMMPRAATRRMAHELRRSVAPLGDQFLIGEVYTGAGVWGVDVIRYYLGPDGLDSVFNFPLMWVIRDVVAHESAGFAEIEAMLGEVDRATEGSGAVMGQILGNHDTTRFLSEAHGDAGGDPWTAPAAQPDDARTFARLRAGLTLLLTLPGLPVLYYGDEVGLAGGTIRTIAG
jgi:glycosidase